MDNQKNEIKKDEVVFEITFKITNKDYKFSLATRKAWIIGAIILMGRLAANFLGEAP